MKSVLLSIKPEWCDKIISEQKTIEIRKSFPKIALPFKVYIYMTKANGRSDGGVIIGEFICDKIFPIRVFENGSIQDYNWHNLQRTCVPYDDISAYIGYNNTGYGWNISNLFIYGTPKKLSEFYSYGYLDAKLQSMWYVDDELWKIKRPPQSYCFVEELHAEDMNASENIDLADIESIPSKSLIEEYNSIDDPAEQLNYFRNLHYKDASDTESYVVAWALDKILPELDKLRKDNNNYGKRKRFIRR